MSKKFVSPQAIANRREIIRGIVVGCGVTGASLLGFLGVSARAGHPHLRPPGAIDESAFLAACIKCGQCVQVCPVTAIVLADITEGFGIGVPYIDARAQACDFSCDATQCVLACPTGALTHSIDKKEQVRMGIAELSQPDICLARQGKGWKGPARDASFRGRHRWNDIDRWKPVPVTQKSYDLPLCDLCVRECPIEGAIKLVPLSDDPADTRRTPKVADSCVGCGVCEMMCPTQDASIVVRPRVEDRHRAHGAHG